MTDVGVLQVHILQDNRSIVGVEIKSTRPQVSRLLKGKTPESVVQLVPALFSLCGKAQGAAAEAAIAAACNIDLSRKLMLERAIACEAIQEHCWRLLLDWPKLLELTQLREEFVRWHSMLREIALGQSDIKALKHEVESFWLGMPIADWFELERLGDLQQWWKNSNSPAARLFASLDVFDADSIYGTSEKLPDVPLLPDWSAMDVLAFCAGKLNADFAVSPTWNATPAETGALTYHETASILRDTLQERPSRVLARMLAKVYDMLQLLNGNFTGRLDFASSQQGTGLAMIKTARGVLMHHVHIVADVVQDYVVVAPTEWNFHRTGAMVAGLLGLHGDTRRLKLEAERQLLSLDPCVGYVIEVSNA